MKSQEAFPIPDQDDDDLEDRVRETTKLLGGLFVARRDVKAWEYQHGASQHGWYPDRCKFTLKDFRDHLLGYSALGTYLLDADNNVKFIAFDIDLQRCCPYYKLRTHDGLRQPAGEIVLDLEPSIGNLEYALHDRVQPDYPWARVILLSTIAQVVDGVEKILGLKTLNVVTGGGAHVLVPFGTLMAASEARGLAYAVMETMSHWEQKNENFWIPERIHPDPPGDHPNWTHYSRSIEIFPKQDEIKNADGLGNLIRLPFGVHQPTEQQTFALADTDYDIPSFEFHAQKPLDALRPLAESLGVSA